MLSRTTEYALRAVVLLAGNGAANTTAHEIAAVTGVPDGYMSKVLHMLVQAGIVTSRRGPSGGFALAAGARRLTMLEVVEAVEPIPQVRECPLGSPAHAGGLCPLHALLADVARGVKERLARTSIADLSGGSLPESQTGSQSCSFPPRAQEN